MTVWRHVSLTEGLWTCRVTSETAPELRVTAGTICLEPPQVRSDGDGWIVSTRIPAQVIRDGVQVLVMSDAPSGVPLGHVALVAGEATHLGVAAEVARLRAELDLLKGVLRRLARGSSG